MILVSFQVPYVGRDTKTRPRDEPGKLSKTASLRTHKFTWRSPEAFLLCFTFQPFRTTEDNRIDQTGNSQYTSNDGTCSVFMSYGIVFVSGFPLGSMWGPQLRLVVSWQGEKKINSRCQEMSKRLTSFCMYDFHRGNLIAFRRRWSVRSRPSLQNCGRTYLKNTPGTPATLWLVISINRNRNQRYQRSLPRPFQVDY